MVGRQAPSLAVLCWALTEFQSLHQRSITDSRVLSFLNLDTSHIVNREKIPSDMGFSHVTALLPATISLDPKTKKKGNREGYKPCHLAHLGVTPTSLVLVREGVSREGRGGSGIQLIRRQEIVGTLLGRSFMRTKMLNIRCCRILFVFKLCNSVYPQGA